MFAFEWLFDMVFWVVYFGIGLIVCAVLVRVDGKPENTIERVNVFIVFIIWPIMLAFLIILLFGSLAVSGVSKLAILIEGMIPDITIGNREDKKKD